MKPFTTEERNLRRTPRSILRSGPILSRKGISLPCEEAEIDLLVKSLIYRRDKLLQQIKSYELLLSNDIHARYMRDHSTSNSIPLLRRRDSLQSHLVKILILLFEEGTGRLSGPLNR
jgi:hypothetical protein